MNQEGLISTAKKLDKILKIVQIVNFAVAAALVCGFLILNIANWINPENVNTAERVNVTLGEFILELADVPGAGIDLLYGWVNCIVIVLLLSVLWLGFRYARKIMAVMMEGNPFDHSVSEHLKKLSYLTLVYGIVGNAGSWIMTAMKMNHYQLQRLADGEQILSIMPKYQLDLGFLIVFFVFLLASYIFRYGAQLQQLSDETL